MTILRTAGKKALSLFLALAMAMLLFLGFSQMVFADEEDTAAETDAYWSITAESEVDGEEGTLTVAIGLLQDIEGITGGTFKLDFDTTVFTLSDTEFSVDTESIQVEPTGTVAWTVEEAEDIEATESLIVFTLAFDASATVDYEITFSASELYGEDLVNIAGATGSDAAVTVSGTIVHEHSYGEITTKEEATCTEDGSINYTCAVCGESVTEIIAATGHTEGEAVTENEVAATCTEDGSYDTVVYCTVCGEELSRETTVVEAGHEWKEDEDASYGATCTTDGLIVYTCSVCGAVMEETIEATGHDYEAVVTDPTCTTRGYTTYTCKNCDNSYKTDYTDATGHDYYVIEEVEATCTEDGYIRYICANNKLHYMNVTLSATGHTEGEAVIENEVAATCTEDGSYDTVVYCTVCGEELSRETTTIKASHTKGEAVIENEVAATCTTAGSYDTVIYCTVCGEELSRETTTVKATDHTWVEYEGDGVPDGYESSEGSCTGDGITYYICSVCGLIMEYNVNHTYETVVTDPTCTEGGYTTYTCTVCGYSYVDDYIDATGHTYETVVTDPTCTEGGYTTYTCTVCGYSYVDDYTDATGHDWGEGTTLSELSCTNDGIVGYTCSTCNYTKVVKTSATGHNYSIVETAEATCTEDGYVKYTCSLCGNSYTETIAATGHTYEVTEELEATCTESGYRILTCSVCGDVHIETIQALGHTEGEAVIENAVEATCLEGGSYDTVVYCTICGEELSRETTEVEATGHTYESEQVNACTVKYTCTVCGLSYITVSGEKTLVEINGETYLFVNGVFYSTITGFMSVDGTWYYIENGIVDSDYTGLYTQTNGVSYYLVNGVCDLATSGVFQVGDAYYYITNSRLQTSINGLIKVDGTWYYFESGVASYTGLVTQTNGIQYYVENGVCDLATTGAVKDGDAYYYVVNSRFTSSINGLINVGGTWYYFENGVASYTGLVTQTNGVQYYVEDGVCDLATTTVYVDEDGTRYYIENSRISTSSGLLQVNGTWYYIESGIVQTGYTGLYTQTNGVTYYIENGICTLTTTLTTKIDGVSYTIVNSRVVTA